MLLSTKYFYTEGFFPHKQLFDKGKDIGFHFIGTRKMHHFLQSRYYIENFIPEIDFGI